MIQPLLADFARLQEMGFIHGNISPDNLIFSNAGSLKLTGFGYVQGKVSLKSDAYAAAEDVPDTAASQYVSRCLCSVCKYIQMYYRCGSTGGLQENESGYASEAICPGSGDPDLSTESALMMGMKLSAKERFQAMKAFARAFGQAQAATPAKEAVPVKAKSTAAGSRPAAGLPHLKRRREAMVER